MPKTPELQLNFQVENPFGNLFRKETVLIACETSGHAYLLGAKQGFYPDGIVRLIGGGVEESDASLLAAVQAELEEEISYKPAEEEIHELGTVVAHATDTSGREYNHTAHLYHVVLPPTATITPKDDITGIQELSIEGIEQLAGEYMRLPQDLLGHEGTLTFSWHDFGKLYGPLHFFTAQLLRSASLN
jgi:8-oxo-dGTP pyrophosphatase MutT (NUDIX family)